MELRFLNGYYTVVKVTETDRQTEHISMKELQLTFRFYAGFWADAASEVLEDGV